jgi:hypothetical protein
MSRVSCRPPADGVTCYGFDGVNGEDSGAA